ncbi:hypothetical protein E1295_36100 [Nonomuraea mesophila]|uniref:Uncharacterized protein n=1 Tax=Nonomuraea mesophila TaxID=2530382 RepID=A0A4R5ELL3_9ACTN|nr:hypothetical protein [Nonomuraea mesophila]TDE35357.1 hypothetical protein E1295_36100 [Nonomuraea mesophila]
MDEFERDNGGKPQFTGWPAPQVSPNGHGDPSLDTRTVTVDLDKAVFEALSRKARADGLRIADVIRTAVEREVGNKTHAITLIQRWNLQREDLDRAADSLDVDRMSDEEWARLGLKRSRED